MAMKLKLFSKVVCTEEKEEKTTMTMQLTEENDKNCRKEITEKPAHDHYKQAP